MPAPRFPTTFKFFFLRDFNFRKAENGSSNVSSIFLVDLSCADYPHPLVRAQIQYFSEKNPRLEELWYLMDVFRTANQAVGRGIRYRDDWCHFYLIDRRNSTHWRSISKLAIVNGTEEVLCD